MPPLYRTVEIIQKLIGKVGEVISVEMKVVSIGKRRFIQGKGELRGCLGLFHSIFFLALLHIF
jgi:hypothetical protein